MGAKGGKGELDPPFVGDVVEAGGGVMSDDGGGGEGEVTVGGSTTGRAGEDLASAARWTSVAD